MATRQRMRLEAPVKKEKVALADRGRMLFIDDVVALLGKNADGTPRKPRHWVVRFFAPEFKHKLGRDPYWWEADVTVWLDQQGAA